MPRRIDPFTYRARRRCQGNAGAGGGGGGGGATYSDTFTRANSALSLGAADTGQIWTPVLGTWGIDANRAYCVADGGAFVNVALLAGAGGADGTLQCTLAEPGGGSGGDAWIVFRSTADASQYIYVRGSTVDPYAVFTDDTALVTQIGTGSLTAARNDVVKIVLAGSSIKVYVNNVLDIDITSTFNQAVTGKGIGTNFGIGPSASRFDNWSFT